MIVAITIITDRNFLETIEYWTLDDGHFRAKHVVNKLFVVLSDFNECCATN
jgi:hypothetical protein